MSETENQTSENSETEVVKTKPLFGTRQEEKPLHNLGANLDQDPEFREAADMEPLPETVEPNSGEVQPTVNENENEVDNIQMDQMTENAQVASTDTPVDGSQADIVAEVSERLQEEVQGTDTAPETVQDEAPQVVSTEVAAAAAADQAASALAVSTNSSDGKTIEQLRAEQDALNRQINEKATAERQAVIGQIKSVVETYNIPVAELVEALGGLKSKRVGSKAKPKFRDPATGKEWSGRGKEPLWIKGQDRSKFAITE